MIHYDGKNIFILALILLTPTVNAVCPENCNSCENLDSCTSCKTGKWDLDNRCQQSCIGNCLNTECDAKTGYCIACKSRFYGLRCQHNCSVCEEEQCGLVACTKGCKPGYYEYKSSETETLCWSCIADCRSCINNAVCNVCEDGFYLYKYETNGRILVQCVQCRNGAACSSFCAIQNCNQCKVQSDSLLCTECIDGYRFNGDICVPNENNCAQGCSSDCDEDGICQGNCNVGWTGERCSESCASNCLKCHKNNANVCEECKGDSYTATCDVGCYPSCIKMTGKQTCRINDGYCLNGCESNLWGQFCNQSCSNGCVNDGESHVCDRHSGTCKSGCTQGYTGDKCEAAVTTQSTTQSEAETSSTTATKTDTPDDGTTRTSVKKDDGTTSESVKKNDGTTSASVKKDDTTVIIIGAAAGGGVLVLILIIVLICCFVKRRRNPDKSADRNGEPRHVNPNALELSDEKANLYAQPMKHKKEPEKEEKQDYIYAQPNKPTKAKKPSKKKIGEPEKLYDNIAIDLEDEQETVAGTNVGTLELENLDEGTISFIETEVKIPTADTYYNTASLIRSRIQVSNLTEYIKSKTDYEKEFEKLPKGLTRTCNEALKPKNLAKNRYNGIYAYDATRVVLQSKNYVNANYIDGHKQSPEYIASLGPTRGAMNKFEAFWEMIWQGKSEKIVMLTHLEESGKMKCEQYWPRQGENRKYGDYKVTCSAEKVFSEFVVTELNVEKGSETRSVTHYHYTAWPDKTVPDTVASLVEFRDKVEQTQTAGAGPMMVHCSAGIGRTGTYIALDILIRGGKEEEYVDIFGCVSALRGQRAHLVQNLEQYIFLHHCVLYALTCDPQPLSDSAIQHVMTDDKITSQYQVFMELQMPPNKHRRSVAINKSRKENRKGADIPGDDHRVRLTLTKQDYINAVYINGYLKTDKFIIAQTPLPNTVEDFVSMLYQEECPCVVCLDEEHTKEKGVGQYLPPANKVAVFGQFQVACRSSRSTDDLVVRQLHISRTGSSSRQEVAVWHYQFRGWNSSERVPTSTQSFLNLIVDIEKARKQYNSDKPITVHCLNGSDRSSVFCVVSILLEKFAVEKGLSVLNTVCHVRSRRRSAFQDIDHFRFCCACAKEMLKISDTEDYYNVVKV